jgi:tripartite-type tricarboxylate transporter receptor subunit TctC
MRERGRMASRFIQLVGACLISIAPPVGAQTYPVKTIRLIVPFVPGRTGSRRGCRWWGGDGARPPGLMRRLLSIVTRIIGAWVIAIAPPVGAQTYPVKTIRLIVPFAPGGNTDIIARAISQKMIEDLGQQIVIDNRGGAASTLGTDLAAKAPPDGYTLLMVSSAHPINPAVWKRLPYDSIEDFAPVSLVANVPNSLVVHPSLPVKNVKELVALARARPDQLLYSTPGRGTSSHLAIEMLASAANLKLVHIPYKGVGPATIDLIAGHVHMQFAAMPGTMPHVRSGRLRLIAQAGRERSPAAPDVPTMIEQGMKDFVVVSGFGMFAPGGTPRPIVDRVNAAVRKALRYTEVSKSLANEGAEPVGNSPEEYDRFNRTEIARWIQVARQAGVQAE